MRRIKNFDELAQSKGRRDLLEIIEAGYEAIDNASVVRKSIRVIGTTLHIEGKEFNLDEYDRISVIGFGKGSGLASSTLVEVMEGKVNRGVVIDRSKLPDCPPLTIHVGSHPIPSLVNLEATKDIVALTRGLTEKDLVLVIVTGGGSSLLCYPESECQEGKRLYRAFLPTGATIHDINLVRKHISKIKGGGLAKLLYPARVLGLIFSDVLGNDGSKEVASGPTYKDESTIDDAQTVLNKYAITEQFKLSETPKEDKWFANVTNILLVSNAHALLAMANKANELGLNPVIIEEPIYSFSDEALVALRSHSLPSSVVLAGGEIRLQVSDHHTPGGRCAYFGEHVRKALLANQIFAAVASDGTDNGPEAGVIVEGDKVDNIHTGELPSNVADLYLLYTS